MKKITIRGRLMASTIAGSAALLAMTAVPAVALLAPSAAMAQDYTSGILSGQVSDAAGTPVAGASVTLTSGQGTVRTATTSASGAFRLPALPIGAYTVAITSPAGSTTDEISVSPGGTSYSFTVSNGEGASDLGEIVVTGARRVQDFNATDTGLSVNVAELSNRVPVGRSITAITMLTPGATQPDASINASARRNQSLSGLSGTSAAESVYYINGLNVTDQRNFLGFAELPYDALQTIDVKTGGYQAEYGRATGGVVNIVTRSGSNEFHGGASVFFSPDSLRSSRGLTYTPGASGSAGGQTFNSYAKSETLDATLWASGPILKDHIFFFGAYNARDTDTSGGVGFSDFTAGSGTQARSVSNDGRWLAKLDFVLNPNHRLEATIFSDEATTDNISYNFDRATFTPTELPTSYSDSGGVNQIYKYTGVFTDWLTVSALYGRVESNFTDFGDSISIAGIRDYYPGRTAPATGYVWLTNGRFGGPFNSLGEDTRETYRVDADVYFNAFGEHHVRFGYDQENLVSVNTSAYSGGALYYAGRPTGNAGATTCFDQGSTSPDGCIRRRSISSSGTFEAQQSAFYLQDSWDLTDTFNLQLGVRNDIYEYKTKFGQTYVEIDNQWAPRLGFNWDPIGDKRSRVYGSLGDYYLPIATNTSIRASSGEVFEDRYFGAVRDAAGNLVLNSDGTPQLGAQIGAPVYLTSPFAPDPRTVASAELEPMYEREFILGYERQFETGLLADWTMGLRYVNRNLKNAIEDAAIGDAVARYCVRNNIACEVTDGGDVYTPADGAAFSAYYAYTLINPGKEATVTLDLNARAPDAVGYNPQTVTFTKEDLALPEAKREYEALEFTFERPFDGRWSLRGSYTLARSFGNYEGAIKSDVAQTDTSLTQDFDHASNMVGSEGYLPNHRRHTLKMFGNYQVNDWFNVGMNFTAASGRKYGCLGYTPTYVDPLTPDPSGTPSGWFCPIGFGGATVATPRGSQGETPWTYNMDLDLGFTLFDSPTRGQLTGVVSVFNLFDNDEVTRVVEQGVSRVDNVSPAANYGYVRSYQSPRSVRFGLRYRF